MNLISSVAVYAHDLPHAFSIFYIIFFTQNLKKIMRKKGANDENDENEWKLLTNAHCSCVSFTNYSMGMGMRRKNKPKIISVFLFFFFLMNVFFCWLFYIFFFFVLRKKNEISLLHAYCVQQPNSFVLNILLTWNFLLNFLLLFFSFLVLRFWCRRTESFSICSLWRDNILNAELRRRREIWMENI